MHAFFQKKMYQNYDLFSKKVRFFDDYSRKVYQEYTLINMRFFLIVKFMKKKPEKFKIAVHQIENQTANSQWPLFSFSVFNLPGRLKSVQSARETL